MGKKEEIVLINYLIANFPGQVVFDEAGNLHPRGW
jgi:hypothetical protein